MLAVIGEMGLMAGRMTILTPEAAIITTAASNAGISNVMPTVLACQTLVTVIGSIAIFIVYKGYKLKAPKNDIGQELPAFSKCQLIALSGIIVMLVLMIAGHVNIGLAAFIAVALLVLGGVAQDGECIKDIPWGTIIMVLGVGAFLGVVDNVGGIKLMSSCISSLMNESTATPLMGISAGLLSLVSSALAVVYPTMMPMCADIAQQVGGSTDPVALMAAVGTGGSLAGLSPMSTGGALILAAMGTNIKNFTSTQQTKIFGELLAIAGGAFILIAGVSALFFNMIAAALH